MPHILPPDNQYPVKVTRFGPGSGWYSKLPNGMNCESLLKYECGGFCPIVHGDILSGQDLLQQQKTVRSFTIIGKIGHGSYSTVWLAKDSSCNRYLALKVLQHDKSTLDNSEMKILKRLGRLQVAFLHTHPPNTFQYLCLGLEPLGSSLSDIIDMEIPLPTSLDGIVGFMRVLLGRVEDLHSKGICHGDISGRNIAFGIHKDAFTSEALKATFRYEEKSYICFSGPEDPPPPRPSYLPQYITQNPCPTLLTDPNDVSKIQLLDFGEAFQGVSKDNVHGTTIFLPPERLTGEGEGIASVKTDLWSLGCALVTGLTGSHLFQNKDMSEEYLKAPNLEAQLGFIDEQLQGNGYLGSHPDQRQFVAWIIHSLVRIDPSLRDGKKAMEMVEELGRVGNELDRR
ncbi:hypothetical protein FQN54_004099 [Arachnomyces sp. PD_36]|nr:hypothetical protein FQN54_004099 [Arachnomyces sp. PD_36]